MILSESAAEVDTWTDILSAVPLLPAHLIGGRHSSLKPSEVALLRPELLKRCTCIVHTGSPSLLTAALSAGIPSVILKGFMKRDEVGRLRIGSGLELGLDLGSPETKLEPKHNLLRRRSG